MTPEEELAQVKAELAVLKEQTGVPDIFDVEDGHMRVMGINWVDTNGVPHFGLSRWNCNPAQATKFAAQILAACMQDERNVMMQEISRLNEQGQRFGNRLLELGEHPSSFGVPIADEDMSEEAAD